MLETRGEVCAIQEALPQMDLKSVSKAFSLVYRKVKPSVVHIDTQREVKTRQNGFAWMFDGGPAAIQEQGEASGVVVDPDGYILTNLHVIDDANEVNVTLEDGRSFTAEVVGSDPGVDLAVVKINASGLTAATWGDSDKLDVGEMVWAIGNPYGLDQTVTSGIVMPKAVAISTTARSFRNSCKPMSPLIPGPVADHWSMYTAMWSASIQPFLAARTRALVSQFPAIWPAVFTIKSAKMARSFAVSSAFIWSR